MIDIHTAQHKRIIMLAASALTFGYFVIWYLFEVTRQKGAFLNWHEAPIESYLLSCAILMMCGVVVLLFRALEDHRRMVFAERYDSDTALPNGTYLNRRLTHLAKKGKLSEQGGLLAIGLDGLVSINIAHGYGVGNQVIRAVSERLSAAIGRDCTLVRISGDTFGLYVKNIDSPEEIAAIADRIFAASNQPFSAGGVTTYISFSIGAVLIKDGEGDVDKLFRHAELSLLHARTQSGVDLIIYSPNLTQSAERLGSLETGLRQALETGQIDVHYQPIVDSGTGKIACVEALARWTHPQLGAVSPTEFVPLAESAGLNEKLGNVVLRRACSEIKPIAGLCLAVNISPNHLLHPDFLRDIEGVLIMTGFEPARLEIEVTESVFIDMPEKVRAVVSQLRALGVAVALDDFGTGYSGLSRITDLEVDRIKIDAAFVKDIGTSQKAAGLFRSIVEMVELSGAKLTVEGIETTDQLNSMEIRRDFWCRAICFQNRLAMWIYFVRKRSASRSR